MPIQNIARDPRIIALPDAAYGIFFKIIIHYWMTECRPLPQTERGLRAIAGGSQLATWTRYWPVLSEAIPAIASELQIAWTHRGDRTARLREFGQRGNSMRKLKALEKKLERSLPAHIVTPRLSEETKREERRQSAALRNDGGFSDV